MKTLLECLYGLLSHITEEHANEVPLELREILNIVTDQLGEFLDKNQEINMNFLKKLWLLFIGEREAKPNELPWMW